MGSSFALALKKARPDTVIVGSDANPLVVRKALEREIVSTANTDLSVVTMADVIVVAAPISALRAIFAKLGVVGEGKPVTDMASTKAAVMEWAAAEGIELLDAISKELGRLYRHLEADDPRLVELFEEARNVRERWSKQ